MSDLPEISREVSDSRGRYVLTVDGIEAELTYSIASPQLIIADHTGVPDALGGRGIAKALVNRLIADARAEGVRIVPLCPYVKAQFARNKDWADVLAG